MTKFPYDEFSKSYLKELLQPLGDVETSRKVPAEIREIDVYFAPSSQSPQGTMQIGLLGRLALEPVSIEPFRNAATRSEIRSCIGKLFTLFAEMERNSKTRVLESSLPRLWILTPTASKAILGGFNATLDEDNWGRGVQVERRATIENLLKVRFGALDNELSSIVQPIALLSPEEFSPLLLRLSREELLSRFS